MAVLPLRLVTAPTSRDARQTPEAWSQPLSFELVRGTLIELSGNEAAARTSTAVRLARDAQRSGEPVLFIEHEDEGVYGPDLAASGMDLDAFVLVRLDPREGLSASFRAAEIALRSGGFGLVYIDLGANVPKGSPGAWQGRLLGLVREHRAVVVLSSARPAEGESLGPLVSLRVVPERAPRTTGEAGGVEGTSAPFLVSHPIAKSKRGDIQALASISYDAPLGL